jgi:hypothetical protein
MLKALDSRAARNRFRLLFFPMALQNPLSSVARSRSRVASVHSFSAGELEATSCKCHDLALATIFAALALILGFNCLFADFANHLHNVFGLVNGLEQVLVAALEELEERPDSDVLECGVAGGKESGKVAMNATGRLIPRVEEEGVVANCDRVSHIL